MNLESETRESKIKAPLKVALLCPGVGLVQRGFERFFQDLYVNLAPMCDVTIYKGGGPVSDKAVVPAFLQRNGWILRHIPLHWLILRTPMHVECLTFALSVLPRLRSGKFDLVHVIDPPLARILFHLRKLLRLDFKLLYTEGTAMPPQDYPPCDFIHQMSPVTYEDACRHGHVPSRMEVLPSGCDTAKFTGRKSRADLRAEYGVGEDTFVVLSVAALNRYHKRTHYLIDEVAAMDGDVLLWLDGSMDHGDPDLPDYARRRLGDRVRITRVESDSVADLYRLCDVKVLCSLHEAYGLVVVEALVSGAAVLAHDNPHFRWLAGSPVNLLNMEGGGNLFRKLKYLRKHPDELESLRRPGPVCQRFDWEAMRHAYVSLYEQVLLQPPAR